MFRSSSFKIFISSSLRPAPPYSWGQSGVQNPLAVIALNQSSASLLGKEIFEDAQTCSEFGMGVLMEGGQFSSSQALMLSLNSILKIKIQGIRSIVNR